MGVFVTLTLVSFGLTHAVASESLWLDELHSAWAAWGTWRECSERSWQGNQPPLFQQILWVWRACISGEADRLRLISQLAVITMLLGIVWPMKTAGGMVRGWSWTLLVGLGLATDAHVIFFGTELRAYGLVLTCSAWLAASLFAAIERPSRRSGIIITLSSFAMVLLHPTAIISVMGLLVAWVLPLGRFRNRTPAHDRVFRSAIPWLLSGVMLAAIVSAPGLITVWRRRDLWNALTPPPAFGDLWKLYGWLPILILPVVILATIRLFQPRKTTSSPSDRFIDRLGIALLFATLSAFFLSRVEVAAVFQRRYLIGLLPWLWIVGGAWWRALGLEVLSWLPDRRRYRIVITALIITTAVGGNMTAQGTASPALRGDFRWVQRGENWRDAIEFVRHETRPGDAPSVAPELLESAVKPGGSDRWSTREREYLTFAVRGPYSVPDTTPFPLLHSIEGMRLRNDYLRRLAASESSADKWWMIARIPADRLRGWMEQGIGETNGSAPNDPKVRRLRINQIRDYGNVSVMEVVKEPTER